MEPTPLVCAAPRPAAELRADVRASAENRPGVYRMVGPGDRVLYIGKSVRVRERLLSYFRAERGEKGEEILRHTHRIDWEYVPSEFGALVREMKAIKRWRPPYNVVHKRDRAYAFIRLTREPAPRLQAVPEVRPDGSLYYGPFFGPERVRTAVREIADLLELRDCAKDTPLRFADQLDFFGAHDGEPRCLRGSVGRCLAPCASRCTRVEYAERAGLALRFLQGDSDAPLAVLDSRMSAAAARLQFEYAAALRDRRQRLEEIRQELAGLRSTIESLSFVYRVPGWAGEERAYVIRRGLVLAELPAPECAGEHEALAARARRLLATGSASGGLGAAEATEILLVARWFRTRPQEWERVWRPDDEAWEPAIAL
jgi:excinuclease ABC subunit C